jgi:hypothetical protein
MAYIWDVIYSSLLNLVAAYTCTNTSLKKWNLITSWCPIILFFWMCLITGTVLKFSITFCFRLNVTYGSKNDLELTHIAQ